MNIILHYGMHKTGSTSIQFLLHKNLIDERFKYLAISSPNMSSDLATLFYDNPLDYQLNKKLGYTEADIQKIKDKLRGKFIDRLSESKNKTVIISAENISWMPLSALTRMRIFLEQYAEQIKLVGYIRPPKGFMESAFQQRVKGGLNRLPLERLMPKYKYGNLEKVFGENNVEYWKFDPIKFVNGDVVMDFCSRLSININSADVARINESLSSEAVSLLYIYNKYHERKLSGRTALQANQELINKLREIRGKKLFFHSSLVLPVLNSHMSSIRWMEERLGESLLDNIEKNDDVAIRSEADLLKLDQEAYQWLTHELPNRIGEKPLSQISLQKAAQYVHYVYKDIEKQLQSD